MIRLLALAAASLGSHGLRTRDSGEAGFEPGWLVRPTGPEVQPVGRHIQALYVNHPHGLSDRMTKYFRPLIALGRRFNATVHLAYGANGPRQILTADHSVEIAASWDRYFDLTANGGNPWHEPENFKGCRELGADYTERDVRALFEGGELCVNFLAIPERLPLDWLHGDEVSLPVSREIATAAYRFRERYSVPEDYGACHIRRCDYFVNNMNCTDPGAVRRAVTEHGEGLRVWVFFLYAEEGYREVLTKALRPLKKRLLFEGEAVINDAHPEDNYFTYLLGKYLNGGARTILETHYCSGGVPSVFHRRQVESHGLFLPRWAEGGMAEEGLGQRFLELEERAGAVCDDRMRGAKLVHPGQEPPRSWESDVVKSHVR